MDADHDFTFIEASISENSSIVSFPYFDNGGFHSFFVIECKIKPVVEYYFSRRYENKNSSVEIEGNFSNCPDVYFLKKRHCPQNRGF
jgi:hypothetical protein